MNLTARAREAYRERRWPDCRAALAEADRAGPLEPADLIMLAVSGYLVGQDGAALDAYARAYAGLIAAADPRGAARCAFHLAFLSHNAEEYARAGGWIARARALVDAHDLGGAEAMLLDSHAAHRLLQAGRAAEALELAESLAGPARDSGDPDLLPLVLLTVGHARITLGRLAEAGTALDEVMPAVTADGITPTIAGTAYCAVIAACVRRHDTRRAREWTVALGDWCDAQPGLVAYRGVCAVHRVEIAIAAGRWDDALAEASRIGEQPSGPVAAEAFYQLGELHRLRGDEVAAEDAYGGRTPGAGGPSPDSSGCGWPRAGAGRPRRPRVRCAPSTATRSPAPTRWRPASRWASRPATSASRGTRRPSSASWRRRTTSRGCEGSPAGPPGRCCSPRASPARRSRCCVRPGRSCTTCRTRRRGRAC